VGPEAFGGSERIRISKRHMLASFAQEMVIGFVLDLLVMLEMTEFRGIIILFRSNSRPHPSLG
jgi:hypothetical protein